MKLILFYRTIANLLQCDVMMTIINTIIERAHHRETKNFQESHLQKVKLKFIIKCNLLIKLSILLFE